MKEGHVARKTLLQETHCMFQSRSDLKALKALHFWLPLKVQNASMKKTIRFY
jgi:hypothetical protein